MFCPRCGVQNEQVQGFCRQCGQALGDVGLALESKPTQSLERLQNGLHRINSGAALMIIFSVIGLAILFFGLASKTPEMTYVAIINLLLGLLIGLPLTFAGRSSLKRAVLLLARDDSRSSPAPLIQPKTTNELLTTGSATDRIPVQYSVTESTTVHLDKAKRAAGRVPE